MKIIFLSIFMIFIFSALSLAEIQTLGTFKTNSCVDLLQACSNCTWINVTSVRFPDSSEANNIMAMEKHGTIYNLTFCNTTQNGQYIVNGLGDVNGVNTVFAYDFVVNPLGKTLTSSQSVMYVLIFIISFVLFLLCLIAGLNISSKNKTDDMTGYVLAVSNMKYLKIFMFALSYLLLMLMTYFGWMVSYGYLDMDFLGNLFNFAFWTLVVLILPLFIIGCFVIIANLVKDSQIADALQRGLRTR